MISVKLRILALALNKLKTLVFSASAVLITGTAVFAETSDLVSHNAFRVCADPANYPQSTEDLNGYENKIAALIAGELDLPIDYVWYPMSTGFIRNTLAANKCDVVIGFSAGHELVLNTNPYYTSTHIFVTKPDSAFADVDHLSDPRLKDAKIGVIAGTQPTTHMARYGLLGNLVPFQLFADRRYSNPNQDLIDALAAGDIDMAVMWGPIGGPMLKEAHPDYVVTPMLKEEGQPFLFARITMGVRQGELEWKRALNSQIRRQQDAIDQILRDYGVPLLTEDGSTLK